MVSFALQLTTFIGGLGLIVVLPLHEACVFCVAFFRRRCFVCTLIFCSSLSCLKHAPDGGEGLLKVLRVPLAVSLFPPTGIEGGKCRETMEYIPSRHSSPFTGKFPQFTSRDPGHNALFLWESRFLHYAACGALPSNCVGRVRVSSSARTSRPRCRGLSTTFFRSSCFIFNQAPQVWVFVSFSLL